MAATFDFRSGKNYYLIDSLFLFYLNGKEWKTSESENSFKALLWADSWRQKLYSMYTTLTPTLLIKLKPLDRYSSRLTVIRIVVRSMFLLRPQMAKWLAIADTGLPPESRHRLSVWLAIWPHRRTKTKHWFSNPHDWAWFILFRSRWYRSIPRRSKLYSLDPDTVDADADQPAGWTFADLPHGWLNFWWLAELLPICIW